MRLFYQNLADDAATIVSSGERSGFPVTNVQHQFLIKRWRSLTCAAEYITFDAGPGQTFTVTAAALVQRNLSAGATVTFMMNDSDVWTSPSFSQVLDQTAALPLASFASKTYRFAHFAFADAANADGFIEIGRVFFGTYLAPSEGAVIALGDDLLDPTNVVRTPSGQYYADLGDAARVYDFAIDMLSDATRLSMKAVYTEVGNHKPLILEANASLPLLYCMMEGGRRFVRRALWAWEADAYRFTEAF